MKADELVMIHCIFNRKIHGCMAYVHSFDKTNDLANVRLLKYATGVTVPLHIEMTLHKRYLKQIDTQMDYRHVIDLALATNDREWFEELVGRERLESNNR